MRSVDLTYGWAAFLGDRLGAERLVTLTSAHQMPTFGAPSDLAIRNWNGRNDGLSDAELTGSVVVCPLPRDEHGDPSLWGALRRSLALSHLTLISCDVPITSSSRHSLDWFSELLDAEQLPAAFVGWADGQRVGHRNLVAIVESASTVAPCTAPNDFRVTAIIPTFNEVDIICSTVDRLLGDQIDVVVVDNWSTDGTYEALAARYKTSPAFRLERYPEAGPSPRFELKAILGRIDDLAAQSDADWIIRQDADEIRESPWTDLNFRDALFTAQSRGYNCVDHTVLNFRPTDATVNSGDAFQQLRHFEFGRELSDFEQVNAWRNQHQSVSLAATAGHRVSFPRQRILPYKFLLRHFPLRSQEQAERKIFAERRARWSADERATGWHTHYDDYEPGDTFVWDPSLLIEFDGHFSTDFLIERLSGVGLPRRERIAPPEREATARLALAEQHVLEVEGALREETLARIRAEAQLAELQAEQQRWGAEEAALRLDMGRVVDESEQRALYLLTAEEEIARLRHEDPGYGR